MKKNYGQIYTLPLTLWLTVFFTIPILIIVAISFFKKGLYGGVEFKLSLDAYKALFNPLFLKTLTSTLFISVITTIFTIIFAIPSAYYIARSKKKDFWIFLIIIPFWTNFLIRIYAWIAILGNNGLVNNILIKLGVIENYVQFLYNQWSVITVLTYVSLPFAILPLYSTIEKFDFSLLEAARDLGASKPQYIYKVLLPNIKSGITTAILFTFIPTFGNYAVPQIIGGKDSVMVGTIIARELTVMRNWPLASSISVALTIMTTIGVLLFSNFNKSKTEELRELKRGIK
ncbi:MAG TPA: ABC transporter permease [Spirochaetota bacterium]|nr:ABC transporter permease [Spirochaetota bacterium]